MLKTATHIDLITVSAAGPDADTVRDLFLEYGGSLSFNTCFGGLDQELATLPGDYAPPRGCLLLAKEGAGAVGCVGLRPIDDVICEMKRLFVKPRHRRAGLGRRLAQTAIARARALYASLGFTACAPYYDNSCLGSDCLDLDLLPDWNRG